jgi:hypothetical protein
MAITDGEHPASEKPDIVQIADSARVASVLSTPITLHRLFVRLRR